MSIEVPRSLQDPTGGCISSEISRVLQIEQMGPSSEIAVVVYSRHPIARRTIIAALQSESRLRNAIKDPATLKGKEGPSQILVLDVCSTSRWAEILRRWQCHGRRVVALIPTGPGSDSLQLQLLRLGVSGVVAVSDHMVEELCQAIDIVSRGGIWVRQRMLGSYFQFGSGESVDNRLDTCCLTIREHQIISFIMRGLSNKEIASALGRSERTIKFHVANILKKLNLSSRRGLLDLEDIPKWLS